MSGPISFLKRTQGLVSTGSNFTHPQEVVGASHLSVSERRALLASWASDVRAVEDRPALRQWDNGAVASVDDIVGALRQLDHVERVGRLSLVNRWTRRWGPLFDSDDDDDPPPSPIAMRLPVLHAQAA